eukprot:jgi/Botrbrau1/1432/Bobra.0063s0124.2
MPSSPSPVPVEDLLDDAAGAWPRLVSETLSPGPYLGAETLRQGPSLGGETLSASRSSQPSGRLASAEDQSSTGATAGSSTACTGSGGSALETGMLDMSAFGIGGYEQEQPRRSGLESGQLDLGAFGFGGMEFGGTEDRAGEAVPQPAPSRQGEGGSASDAVASGMLDMSAFGLGGFHDPAEPGAGAVQPGGTMHPVESGTLDPTAFGFGGVHDEPVHARQAYPSMDSGTLDPTAFGFGGATEEPVQATLTATSSAATSVTTGMIDLASFGMTVTLPDEEPHVPPRPAAVQPGVESGMLDMSAFGLGHAMDSHIEPHEGKPNGLGGTHLRPAGRPPHSPFGGATYQDAVASTGNASVAGAAGRIPGSADVSGRFPTAERGSTSKAVQPRGGSTTGAPTFAGANKSARMAERTWKVAPPPFSPLSGREVADLARLAGLDPASPSPTRSAGSADSDSQEGGGTVRQPQNVPGLSPEELDEVVALAGLLCESRDGPRVAVNDVRLDDPSHRLLLALRLARGTRAGGGDAAGQNPGAASGGTGGGSHMDPHMILARTGSFATAASAKALAVQSLSTAMSFSSVPSNLSNAGAGDPGKAEEVSWAGRVGLQEGLSGSAIMWALLSVTTEPLLQACLDEIGPPEREEAPSDPKEVFNYAGQKKLDLGFGPGGGSAPLPSSDNNPLAWETLRKAGAAFWLPDESIRPTAEALAKAQFAVRKDPHDCSLMYLALGKRTLLQGLCRTGNHKKLSEFLGRDFSDERNQAAACKNAFVLLSQHRHELAAAFFILGGSHKDALGVCANEMGDPQLALFVSRILENGIGALTARLIEHELILEAEESQDPWGSAILRWMLGEPVQAMQALIQGSSTPPPTSVPRPSDALPDPVMALALLNRLAKARPDVAPRGLGAWEHCCLLACHAAACLDVWGLPVLALESLQALEMRPGDTVGRPRKPVLASWRERLATAALLRGGWASGQTLSAVPSWEDSRSSLEGINGNLRVRSLSRARQNLNSTRAKAASLQAAGLVFDLEAVLERYKAVQSAMEPPESGEAAEMPITPSEALSRVLQSREGTVVSPAWSLAEGPAFDDGFPVLCLPRENFFSICCNLGGEYGPDTEARPFVVASAKAGLVQSEVLAQAAPPSSLASESLLSASSSSGQGSVFTALLSDMLEAVRWPPDPWAVIAPLPPDASASAETPRRSLPPSPAAARVKATCASVLTVALDSHPYRQLYLSGSASGEIYLWQFGQKGAVAGYTPLAASEAALPSWSESMFAESSRAWSASTSTFASWGQPQSVRFSDCGERFAAVGEGGGVATWRIDAPRYTSSDTGTLGRADWCHQCLSKRGVAIAYVGGSSSVLAVAGYGAAGNAVIWDTLAPVSSGPVCRFTQHTPLVTAMQVIPGGRLLAMADEAGSVSVVDLRMMASPPARAPLWQAKAGAGVTCLASGLLSSGAPILAAGGKEGTISVWAADKGSQLVTIDTLAAARAQRSRSRSSFFMDSSRNAGSVITGLTLCPEGLLSCSLDGVVRLHPCS